MNPLKTIFAKSILICLCSLLDGTPGIVSAQTPEIVIEEIIPVEGIPEILWLSKGDHSWKKGKPFFEMSDAPSGTGAKGWMCVTNENIHIAVEVKDDIQYNTQILPDMWKEDGLQISLDVRGDGTGKMPVQTKRIFGPDDEALGMALLNGKAAGIVWSASNGTSGPIAQNKMTIVRNDKKHTTFYEIALPWAEFKTEAGLFPTLGLAVWVNDKDPGKELVQLKFGLGADGLPATGLFKKVKIGTPPSPKAASCIINDEVWGSGDSGEILLMTADKEAQSIEVSDGRISEKRAIPVGSTISTKRYKIRFTQLPSSAKTINTYLKNNTGRILTAQSLSLIFPERVYYYFLSTIDSLMSQPLSHPLFARHLISLRALVMTEWARLQLYKFRDPALSKEVLGFVRNIHAGVLENGYQWETFLDGKRPLVMSFISGRDNTLQFYQFTLPENWNIANKYPLYMELHGAGNPNPLANISAFQGAGNKMDLFGYSDPKSYIQYERSGYHLAPFGRGNSGYVDIGEIDIWEAMRDVETNFKIDENKRYLFGFSMGGGGTFINALRTPDMWAAVGIYAGAVRSSLSEHIQAAALAKNLSTLPVWIWCGEDDGLIGNYNQMKSELEKYGNKPGGFTTPGVGHNYRTNEQEAGIKWMQQFTRKRPDHFSFISDTQDHRGAWGITMERNIAESGLPQFDCVISKNEVRIESKGTPGLEVKLGEDGLGLTGDVVVFWNGKDIYHGNAKTISLK